MHYKRRRTKKKEWCRDPGSNQGPSDLQSDALPTELSRRNTSRLNVNFILYFILQKKEQNYDSVLSI